ncbi:hypothetical protein GSI_02072 [Ganoderma sinense ZZ0214-1]|uniref:F-box domain-containing protein n=1 Tax=Ganoderma sinense ZZ0214-1 TaxID=1077348 RepID=A0A2G8SNJ4_9APHY|nr:hypothetical protein GSI_02072 [Ganoderma sinense ZZ0214-1]
MPALESLEIPLSTPETQEPRDDDFVDLQLTSERFPRLQSLTTALTVAPQDIQVYARLRKLSLSDCPCNFSFSHFLEALAAATSLESLELVTVLQRIQGEWVGSAITSKNPLSLQHLKVLELVAHPPIYTSRFLSHVLLSPSAIVWINGDLGGVAEPDIAETISAMLPPNPANILPALALVPDAIIRAYGAEYSLSCSIEPRIEDSPLISLLIGSSAIPFWSGSSSHHAARDLLSVLTCAPLTKLNFQADCSDIAPETWAEIFSKYPLLENLELGIAGLGTTETAFAGLMNAAAAPNSLVPCPRLRTVGIMGQFSEDALDTTLRCLRDRAAKGHQLETITMDLWGAEVGREDVRLKTTYVPQLQELVKDRCTCECGE